MREAVSMDADNLMPKLLALLICTKKVTACHLTTGRPPQIMLTDHIVMLETQSLSLQDTLELVHCITPDFNQTELADDGRTNFDFELSEDLWIKVSISGVPGDFVVKARQLPDASIGDG